MYFFYMFRSVDFLIVTNNCTGLLTLRNDLKKKDFYEMILQTFDVGLSQHCSYTAYIDTVLSQILYLHFVLLLIFICFLH